jgi:hypothetical protein
MIKGILEGIACVAFGVLIFYNTYKHPVEGKYDYMLLPNFSGYMGGIGLVLIGILLIIGYFPPL